MNQLVALIHPGQPASSALVAITLTAAIVIPAGFLFGFLWAKMAASISRKRE